MHRWINNLHAPVFSQSYFHHCQHRRAIYLISQSWTCRLFVTTQTSPSSRTSSHPSQKGTYPTWNVIWRFRQSMHVLGSSPRGPDTDYHPVYRVKTRIQREWRIWAWEVLIWIPPIIPCLMTDYPHPHIPTPYPRSTSLRNAPLGWVLYTHSLVKDLIWLYRRWLGSRARIRFFLIFDPFLMPQLCWNKNGEVIVSPKNA